MECHFATLILSRCEIPIRKSLIYNDLHLCRNVACRVPIKRPKPIVNPLPRVRMKKDRKEIASSEPLGIIISRGDKTEPTPLFSAYIWGPVPDPDQDAATRAA